MFAPKFDDYLFGLDLGYRGLSNNVTYNAEAYPIIDEIMSLLKKITPCSSNGCRELWFCLERGPIEAYRDFEEELEEGNVATYEEFVEKWKEEYPDEEKWYTIARFSRFFDEIFDYAQGKKDANWFGFF